jgi:hypothetical protein
LVLYLEGWSTPSFLKGLGHFSSCLDWVVVVYHRP